MGGRRRRMAGLLERNAFRGKPKWTRRWKGTTRMQEGSGRSEMEKKLREADIPRRRVGRRGTHWGRERERACVQSLLFYLLAFLFRRCAPSLCSFSRSLSLSPSFYLFPSLSLLFSLSLSTTCLPFSPVRAGEKRLPILRQGQDRDFNQLARFLGPGKWLVIRLTVDSWSSAHDAEGDSSSRCALRRSHRVRTTDNRQGRAQSHRRRSLGSLRNSKIGRRFAGHRWPKFDKRRRSRDFSTTKLSTQLRGSISCTGRTASRDNGPPVNHSQTWGSAVNHRLGACLSRSRMEFFLKLRCSTYLSVPFGRVRASLTPCLIISLILRRCSWCELWSRVEKRDKLRFRETWNLTLWGTEF